MVWYNVNVERRKDMGACSFMAIGYGKTMREAYQNLVEEYEIEYGMNPYNGNI